jgi:23S rRNA (cytosine1962-C5)-methyltransferase
VQADAFEWLRQPRSDRFDLVILDPPSLARRQTDRPAALKAYEALAASGFALTAPGGITVCCSCSAHIRADEFFQLVTEAARATNRPFAAMHQTREPLDHHGTFPEAEYLKALYIHFDPATTLSTKGILQNFTVPNLAHH